jgi:hypothetical protein
VAAAVGGAVSGFLLTYLWTSVRVRELLEEGERLSQRDVVPKLVGKTIAEAEEDLSVTALRLVTSEGVADNALIASQGAVPGAIVLRGSEVKVDV